MRRLSLPLALGFVALGVLATTTESAKAYWPVGIVGPRAVNGHGNSNLGGQPAVRVQSNGFGVAKVINQPSGSRAAFMSNGTSRLWYGSGSTTANQNQSSGWTMQTSSSTAMSTVFSPYASFRSANVQSSSSAPIRNSFSTNTSFINGTASLVGWYSPNFVNLSPPLSAFAQYVYFRWNPGLINWAFAYQSHVHADWLAGSRPIFAPNYLTPNLLSPSNLKTPALLTPKILK